MNLQLPCSLYLCTRSEGHYLYMPCVPAILAPRAGGYPCMSIYNVPATLNGIVTHTGEDPSSNRHASQPGHFSRLPVRKKTNSQCSVLRFNFYAVRSQRSLDIALRITRCSNLIFNDMHSPAFTRQNDVQSNRLLMILRRHIP